MREKLIELLMQADSECFNRECKDCEHKGLSNCDSILTADYLIANGVVIPVRCGECVYFNKYGVCIFHDDVMLHDDYCSDGEPKESEE